ncbi:hypothetical protein EWM64_g7424 [Hericium alpestre]|uniref:3-hydroxyisobutyryl-CoA hydrolase n=1 Tax=Hericium alpestre TaxID=135208 RepID=A0A4Y9ZSX7_9AGAM|nr:hypothetical protein EWM64_g7424 [Hericium alpestre]
MLDSIAAKVEHWNDADLSGAIASTGNGKAFSAGGDVADVVLKAGKPQTRQEAIDYFRHEFGTDYILASLRKPYVAIMDGITFGGGAGLCAGAPFRVATEQTLFSMPETGIGYFPDVGASYFLSRLDGEIGTYLALTGNSLSGRATFEHGFATHYVASQRVPILLERLATIEDPTLAQINAAIEELYFEREPSDPVPPLTGAIRVALDKAFGQDTVEGIVRTLRQLAEGADAPETADVVQWAKNTLATLEERSPTSLKVALMAIRKGRTLNLLEALQMELNIAAAYCKGASPDFKTGVTSVIIEKKRGVRPAWKPERLGEVQTAHLETKFFTRDEGLTLMLPQALQAPHDPPAHFTRFALPTEDEIGAVVRGEHPTSSGEALTTAELLAKFEDLRRGKHGVAEKVREVVARRCEADEAGYLRWKH